MKLKKIINEIENNFPLAYAEDWDNVGLLFGDKRVEIKKVIVALDLTKEVFEKSLDLKAQLILTHHPFIFTKSKNPKEISEEFLLYPYKKGLQTRIENTGMCVYSAHTNFDGSKKGMSFHLLKELGFTKKDTKNLKYGKMLLEPYTTSYIIESLKSRINIEAIETNVEDLNAIQSGVAFLPGAAGMVEINAAKEAGATLIVTSDIKWSTWVAAREEGIYLLSVSHVIEDIFVKGMAQTLEEEFKDVEFIPLLTIKNRKL